MIRPVRITPPAEMPITVEAAKIFLRVDGADDDALIEALIGAAVDHLDGRAGILGRCLVTQVWQYQAAGFQRQFSLGMPGAVAATVYYFDQDGFSQELPQENITFVDTSRGSCLVVADRLPTAVWYGPVTIDVTFGTASDEVPAALVQAIRMLVAHWYAHREAVASGSAMEVPLGVNALIGPYRWISI